jgi:hypothetical protein
MSKDKSKLKEFYTLFWSGVKGLAGDYKGFCGAMWGIILLFPLYATAMLCYWLTAMQSISLIFSGGVSLLGFDVSGNKAIEISAWCRIVITTAIVHGLILYVRRSKEFNETQGNHIKDENLEEQIKEQSE